MLYVRPRPRGWAWKMSEKKGAVSPNVPGQGAIRELGTWLFGMGNTRGGPAASGSRERGRFRAMLTHCRCPTVLFPEIYIKYILYWNIIYISMGRELFVHVCMCVMCIWKWCARSVHICKSRCVHKHTRLCTHTCFRSVARELLLTVT
jgi:hypothetical protein